MAKLRPDPITAQDLTEYLDNHSDFSFELQVLKDLTGLGFTCEHGGSYTDRATKKAREFDIRATKVFGKRFLRLAVECKNVRPQFPLLVSCVPRRDVESFNEIVLSVNPDKYPLEERSSPYIPAFARQSRCIRLEGKHSLYQCGKPVGKSCAQVGKSLSGEIIASDADVYDKWAQALSSADELTSRCCRDGNDETGDLALSLVIPVLVVPDGRLWMTEYDAGGDRVRAPEPVDRCSYFVALQYGHDGFSVDDDFTVSHLEFLTTNGLRAFVEQIAGDEDRLGRTFPPNYVVG